MPLFRPGKPYRLLRLTAAATVHSSLSDIAWDSAEEDGDWAGSDLTSSVVNVAGLYIVTAGYARSTSSGSSSTLSRILVNGVFRRGGRAPNVNAAAAEASCSLIDQLEVGDVVKMQGQTGTGGTVLLAGCGLELARIGPVRWT